MKKLLVFILLITLFTFTSAFSVKLGIAAKNWNGCIDGSFHRGILVVDSIEGYPAFGELLPGDIISEALVIPSSCFYNNCCQSCQMEFFFTPCTRLINQLSQLRCNCVKYYYEKIYNWNLMCSLLTKANCNSTMVMRVFRTSTCEWLMVSLTIDTYGNPILCCYPCNYNCYSCTCYNPCSCDPCNNIYYSKNCYCCDPCQNCCNSQQISVYVSIN